MGATVVSLFRPYVDLLQDRMSNGRMDYVTWRMCMRKLGDWDAHARSQRITTIQIPKS